MVDFALRDRELIPNWMHIEDGRIELLPEYAALGEQGLYYIDITYYRKPYPDEIFQQDTINIIMGPCTPGEFTDAGIYCPESPSYSSSFST